jgi:hypothetical protein
MPLDYSSISNSSIGSLRAILSLNGFSNCYLVGMLITILGERRRTTMMLKGEIFSIGTVKVFYQ